MATTTWIAGLGDWNTASNWSNGVPGATDTAVFSTQAAAHGTYTVTGGGAAGTLLVQSGPYSLALGQYNAVPLLAGTYTGTAFTVDGADVVLGPTSVLAFGSGSVTGTLQVDPGANLGSTPLTLAGALLDTPLVGTLGAYGDAGTLANPLVLVGADSVIAGATLVGPITGTGTLHLAGDVVLANGGNTYSGGTVIGPSDVDDVFPFSGGSTRVELAATGAAGTGPLFLGGGTLVLDPGVVVGAITTATVNSGTIDATDQSDTVFAGQFSLNYVNGSGHPTIIGATAPGPELFGEGPEQFGQITVQGGTGSVTIFGGDDGGTFQGGTAGHNVLVGGANLTGYTGGSYVGPPGGGFAYPPNPVTLHGGGDGDLLVEAGTYNGQANLLIAGAGAETLTGSGSTANGFFYGGTGADLIALGSGYSVVVAGSGAETIAGGAGQAAIFAGAGQDVILGGAGADYVQAGAGNATLFASAGADLVGVVDGQSGGSLTVVGFRVGTDQLGLQGYGGGTSGITNSQVVNGSTALTLVDGTHVTLQGVANLGASSFV